MKAYYIISMLFATAAFCYANSAVSEVNGKIGSSYGQFESDDGVSFEGSITFPVQQRSGIQLDGLYTKVADVEFSGAGGHLFWRDSEKALLGIAYGNIQGDLVDSYETSLEGEYYFDRITLGAKSGMAFIEYEEEVSFIESKKRDPFGLMYIGIYPTENLLFTAAVEHRFDNTYYSFELEYELPIPGVSINASAMRGDHGYDHFTLGLRYYIGTDKTLKSRHRSSDPRNILTGILYGVGNYGAEYNKLAEEETVNSGSGGGYSGSYGGISVIAIGGSYEGSLNIAD